MNTNLRIDHSREEITVPLNDCSVVAPAVPALPNQDTSHAMPPPIATNAPQVSGNTSPSNKPIDPHLLELLACEDFGVRQALAYLEIEHPAEHAQLVSGGVITVLPSNRSWSQGHNLALDVVDMFATAFGETRTQAVDRINNALDSLPWDGRNEMHSEYCCDADFPVDALPSVVGDLATAISHAQGSAPVTAATLAIGVASASLGKGIAVAAVKGLITFGNLYLLGGGKSGSGKSIVAREVLKPLYDHQRALADKRRTDAAQVSRQMRTVQERIRALESSDLADDSVCTQLAALKAEEYQLTSATKSPRTIVDDVTAEKLAILAAENNGVIASISPDARSAVKNVRGKHLREGSDEDIYLKGFSVEHLLQDRVTRASIEAEICLTIVWLTQMDHLSSLYLTDDLAESGLLCRFLPFEIPYTRQHHPLIEVVFPSGEVNAFHERIRELLDTYHQKHDGPYVISPTPEARAVIASYIILTDVWMEETNGEWIRPFACRLAEQALRMAVVFHSLEHGSSAHNRPLAASTMRAAVRVVKWFFEQTLTLFGNAVDKKQEARLAAAREYVRRNFNGITARDLHRSNQGLFPDVKSARDTLKQLTSEGAVEEGAASRGSQRYYPVKRKA